MQFVSRRKAYASFGYQVAKIESGLLSANCGGYSEIGSRVTDETLFQVASCSKIVTALAALTLVRDGVISLDAPVNEALETWRLGGRDGNRATLAALLSHTAGTNVSGFEGYDPDVTLPSVLDVLNGEHPANSQAIAAKKCPIRTFKYSGGGTVVVQKLIEDASGTTFSDYVRTSVFRPLGLSHPTFEILPSADHAVGYLSSGKPVDGGFMRFPESAPAGLWATATDLAIIMKSILLSLSGGTGALLPRSLATRMITPVAKNSGLGIFVLENRAIWHDGRNPGFEAFATADLQNANILTATTNVNGGLKRALSVA